MATFREVEVKREVAAEVAMPDLSALPGVAEVELLPAFDLEAVYLDTFDLRLANARMTLRRRTGGRDAGWHLKQPAGADERTELQSPLEPAATAAASAGHDALGDLHDDPSDDLLGAAIALAVPPELAAAVRGRVREAPLEPVAVLRTRRTVRNLRDAAGRILAEAADDVVTSRSGAAGAVHLDSWREWEIELIDGDRDLLAAAVDLFEAAGATAGSPSKLARALGPRLRPPTHGLAGDLARATTSTARQRRGTAGAALVGYVRTQREEILGQDPRVRRDEPDSVHQLRTATRRLRSVLRSYRPLLERAPVDALRAELSWLAGILGAARDAEVLRERCAELLAAEPAELVRGPIATRLDTELAAAYRRAHGEVLEVLDSPRYFRLMDALDQLVASPPLTEEAGKRAAAAMPRLVRRDWKRLRRAYAEAVRERGGPTRDHLLHEARKAAKRARHASEVAMRVSGSTARQFAASAKKFADQLGQHHDSVELRHVLLLAAERAHFAGEDAFSYGRLHALEQAHAGRLEGALPALWARLATPRRRRWLR